MKTDDSVEGATFSDVLLTKQDVGEGAEGVVALAEAKVLWAQMRLREREVAAWEKIGAALELMTLPITARLENAAAMWDALK